MTPDERNDARDIFLVDGGEMGRRIRAHDWSQTAIGPVESWSPALRLQVNCLLANRFPLLLWWGPTFCSIYNDAYAPILGSKHPWALGKPVSECWSEIWDVLRPLIETPFGGGPATWIEDFQLEIRRHGFLEEGHFTVAYSPVPDEAAPSGIGGVLATVHEITGKVIGERRVAALRDLGSQASGGKSAEQACEIAAQTLEAYGKDLPFVRLYLIDADRKTAKLAGSSGAAEGDDTRPLHVALDAGPELGWPIAESVREDTLIVVDRLQGRFRHVPRGSWSDPPHTAVVLPIPSNKLREPAGVLVAGVSPRLRLDEHYLDFFELLRTQLANGIANARAYEEEKKRAEALAQIDLAKTAFFSNVSHEFRTPLTLMLGPVEDLLDRGSEDLPPEVREQLALVHRNGLRLLRLVNTLLDFSRIEAGRVRATYEPTDLCAFTIDLASGFRSAIESAGLRLTVDCRPFDAPVFVDREMWEKIVLNLLSNAFKFTFEGEIRVALRATDTHVTLTVADTGTGIPESEMPHLFERFHRVENANGRTHEGSGIGLALVHELTKLHGGTISAESTVDLGTSFEVTLPLGSAHLPPDQIGASGKSASKRRIASPFVEEALRWLPDDVESGAAARGLLVPRPGKGAANVQRPRVLVADDNADMRQYVERLLADDHDVVAVADGEAALAVARDERPDLVLSDVMMPRLDGFELMRELRRDARTRDIPVILLSARAGEESRVEGVSAGADDYLTKPFSARELKARVGAHLAMARMRRASAASLRESEERLREHEGAMKEAQRLAHVGNWSWDAITDRYEGSDELCRIYGHPLNEPLPNFDEQDGSFYPHESWKRQKAAVEHALRTGEGYRLELPAFRGGERIWIAVRGEPARDSSGATTGLRGTVQDITERKKLEFERERVLEREREARAAAERVAQLKDDFLATLSHELRTPLNAVLGWAQLLKIDAHDPAKVLSAAEIIHRNARLQAQLISDLLDLSRIGAGKMRLDVQQVDCASVIQAAIESMKPAADAKQIRIRSAVDPVASAVRGDPARLHQVIWNLLSNAVKFTPRGGEIHVASSVSDSQVEIRVADTGEGIAREFLPHIFERFRQADASTSRQHGGLGIGLALVKQLVELHGGRVRVKSDGKGKGSCFVIELPRFSAAGDPGSDERSGESLPAPYSPTQLGGLRVLVVDDEPDAVTMVQRILEGCQARVGTATSTEEALALLRTQPFDVLVSDIGMPGRDGYALVKEMRSRGLDMPAIALTAFARDEDRRKALVSGYQAHLQKPINAAELLATVARLCGKPARASVET